MKKEKIRTISEKRIKMRFFNTFIFLFFVSILMNVFGEISVDIGATDFLDSNNSDSMEICIKGGFMKASAFELSIPSFSDSWDRAISAMRYLPVGGLMLNSGDATIDWAGSQLREKTAKMFVLGINWILYGVLIFISYLTTIAVTILDYSLDVKNFKDIVQNQSIYNAWTFVRDFLNLFFMLILLFSAFATIFQVEKYNLKKMIVLLVVMALLVNFSFPITLFIIDFSNSIMYFFAEAAFSGVPSPSAGLGEIASFADSFAGSVKIGTTKEMTAGLLLAIVVSFVFFITILALALNLIIRVFALAMLIVLSPVGFALSFFSGTKSVADSWWDNIFKYSFMGPSLLFFLLLAMNFFGVSDPIEGYSGEDRFGLVKSLSKNVLAVTFLWMGLIASQKFGGMASGVAMNFAKSTGKRVRQGAWGGTKMMANSTGIPGVVKTRYTDISNKLKKGRETREARIAGALGSSSAMSDLERKRFEEDKKQMKNYTNDNLKTKANSGDVAAAEELLNRKKLDEATYRNVMNKSTNTQRNSDLTDRFKGANKESRIDIVASIDARNKAEDATEVATVMNDNGVNEDVAKEMILERELSNKLTKLNHSEFAKQDFDKIYAEIDKKLGSSNSLDIAEGTAMRDSMYQAYAGIDNSGKDEVLKNLSANQRMALSNEGVI